MPLIRGFPLEQVDYSTGSSAAGYGGFVHVGQEVTLIMVRSPIGVPPTTTDTIRVSQVTWALDDSITAARITSRPDGAGVLVGVRPGYVGKIIAFGTHYEIFACGLADGEPVCSPVSDIRVIP